MSPDTPFLIYLSCVFGSQADFIFRCWNTAIARSSPTLLAGRRPQLAIALTLVVAGVGLVAVRSGGPELGNAVRSLGGARPDWIVVATLGFLSAAVATAAAWRSALTASAGAIGFVDTAARYAVGGLVNTFAPLRMGDAVRVGLLSRAFDRNGRVSKTTGVLAFLGVARIAALILLLLPAAALGILPARIPLLACGTLAVATLGARLCAPRLVEGVVGRFLEAFRLIGRSPAATVRVLLWLLLSSASRVAAAAAAAAALGVARPIAAAVIIVPALELSSLFPLTPGNLGVTSGVVALALRAQGVDTTTALAVGIGFHAVETVVGISFGVAGAIRLASAGFPRVQRVAALAGGLAAFAALGGILNVFLDVS